MVTEDEKITAPEEAHEPEIPVKKKEAKSKSFTAKNAKNAKANAKIEELQRKADEAAEKYLRTLAEFDNFRKRTSKEKGEMYNDGVTAAVLRFLPVIDNFERAVGVIPPETLENDGNLKGFGMILRQMKDILTGLGVTEIEAAGKPFDPNLHAAVMMAESGEHESGVVMEELLKGYIYKDRPIRHSMVKVAE